VICYGLHQHYTGGGISNLSATELSRKFILYAFSCQLMEMGEIGGKIPEKKQLFVA